MILAEAACIRHKKAAPTGRLLVIGQDQYAGLFLIALQN